MCFDTRGQCGLLARCGAAAHGLENEPANTVVVGTGMREKIPRHARKPAGSEGIEPGLLDRIEQVRGVPVLRLMSLMNRGVMEAPLQDDTIGKRTQAAVSRRVRAREQGIGVVDVDERASARGNRPTTTPVAHSEPRTEPEHEPGTENMEV